MSKAPIYYSAEEVERVLNWPLVNDAVEAALVAVGRTQSPEEDDVKRNPNARSYASQPPRVITSAAKDRSKLLLAMPGFVGNYQLSNGKVGSRNTLGCKLVTSFSGNARQQPPIPNILANILLFDTETGRLNAIVDGTDITTWRTASASVVATKYLYFRRFGPQAERERIIDVAIVGCGVQGQIHALAMCSNFRVRNIYLWNRTANKAVQLAQQLNDLHLSETKVHVCESAGAAVRSVDIICIATFSPEALIRYEDVRQQRSLHINAVGAGQVHFGEVGQDIYDHANVYVDSMASARVELKDLKANIVGEVGEVILQEKYPATEGYTVFQAMGIAAEDACVAQAVCEALSLPSSRL